MSQWPCAALPAVGPAPAGAAAAGSPAASAPPPAVYGCTPNQSAARANGSMREEKGSPGNQWHQHSRKGEEREKRMKRCESQSLVRMKRGGRVENVKDQHDISCERRRFRSEPWWSCHAESLLASDLRVASVHTTQMTTNHNRQTTIISLLLKRIFIGSQIVCTIFIRQFKIFTWCLYDWLSYKHPWLTWYLYFSQAQMPWCVEILCKNLTRRGTGVIMGVNVDEGVV